MDRRETVFQMCERRSIFNQKHRQNPEFTRSEQQKLKDDIWEENVIILLQGRWEMSIKPRIPRTLRSLNEGNTKVPMDCILYIQYVLLYIMCPVLLFISLCAIVSTFDEQMEYM